MDCSMPGSSVLHRLWEFAQIQVHCVVMLSNHFILCCPLLLLPLLLPSIRIFSNELAFHIRWSKYWSFSFSSSPSNECSGLDSFRIDWFDFHIVQGSLKNFLQHHYLKASVLWHSAFFMVQLSHPYITTGKTVALTIQTFVGKVLSVFFNMLSRFVIAFLPRSKRLLISWLQSLSKVILEPKKIKSVTASTFSPSICHEVMRPGATILVFWMLNFKPAFLLSSFILFKRLFSSSSCSSTRVVLTAYVRLMIFLLAVLIPICDSSSPAFCMMYSKLNKQGDNIQPWLTPFPILNQSVVYPVLTAASWPAYKFLGRQVSYSSLFKNFPQFAVIHTFKSFSIVSKAEVDVFRSSKCWQFALWFLCLFETQLVHLEVLGPCSYVERFWT